VKGRSDTIRDLIERLIDHYPRGAFLERIGATATSTQYARQKPPEIVAVVRGRRRLKI
jgi:hypothetical protein